MFSYERALKGDTSIPEVYNFI